MRHAQQIAIETTSELKQAQDKAIETTSELKQSTSELKQAQDKALDDAKEFRIHVEAKVKEDTERYVHIWGDAIGDETKRVMHEKEQSIGLYSCRVIVYVHLCVCIYYMKSEALTGIRWLVSASFSALSSFVPFLDINSQAQLESLLYLQQLLNCSNRVRLLLASQQEPGCRSDSEKQGACLAPQTTTRLRKSSKPIE